MIKFDSIDANSCSIYIVAKCYLGHNFQNNPDFDFDFKKKSSELFPDQFLIPTIFMILLKLPDILINFNFPALELKKIMLEKLICTL